MTAILRSGSSSERLRPRWVSSFSIADMICWAMIGLRRDGTVVPAKCLKGGEIHSFIHIDLDLLAVRGRQTKNEKNDR